MSCLLAIETATTVCSVALSYNNDILFNKESFEGPSHAALLGVYVEEALNVVASEGLKPDAVAVSSGPGSYTGLRIGVSVAKGLCFGYGIPLISVPTLEILASKVIAEKKMPSQTLYCSMLDARRMEVYAAIYDENLHPVRDTMAEIVTADTYVAFLKENRVCFFGNGAAKCKEVIVSEQAIFLDDIHPLAIDMIPLSRNYFDKKQFEDVAYFEPNYLKDFIATIPKNKVLGNL
ncbi:MULTISPECIES: tRNA (adenosine(37)-N6)-threonylcarbamoyltransferase complex dimerization subunit type 1 TsaB [unclassified Parabacteroides]|uniref:tRNA (adenosine(37)-N6)-threonylcarbamoyltransferase complex dimerization subunit type 1 TsaB n=1 Tax=unclassified Parabacteroides TaxID=2649774 RepID=UPI00247692AD|nr:MULTISPECIES: tRNA (adenosine(37)-N6)-threonylcarbamoyltransferase complex dimerization subunit type 1 TsaB [unclassified Parabacteroides]